jgi:hypothetical protein
MVGNMRFYAEKAEDILVGIIEGLRARNIQDPVVLLGAMEQLNSCRKRAQDCAVDAAPYLHHRLASIEIKSDEEDSNLIHTVTRRIIDGTRTGAVNAEVVSAVS